MTELYLNPILLVADERQSLAERYNYTKPLSSRGGKRREGRGRGKGNR